MAKRLFDILFSLSVLFLFCWLIFIVWIIAAVDTLSNGFFIQERIGQFGTKFKIIKLRTMRNSSATGEKYISKVGRFLRHYKLDELPQFINVLEGDMSVVGPRPDLPGYYELLEGESRKILELRPGITSIAALKYSGEESILKSHIAPLVYNDSFIFPDKVRLNLQYYYERSFWGDIKIILKSVALIFRK